MRRIKLTNLLRVDPLYLCSGGLFLITATVASVSYVSLWSLIRSTVLYSTKK